MPVRGPREHRLKFQPDRIEGVNVVTAVAPGVVRINGQPHGSSLVLPVRGAVVAWPCDRLESLAAAHFELLLAHRPELVIFGSGERLRFVGAHLLRPLIDKGVGVETMDTAAACRTYNVLASEGRAVVAALLLEGASPAPQAAGRRPI